MQARHTKKSQERFTQNEIFNKDLEVVTFSYYTFFENNKKVIPSLVNKDTNIEDLFKDGVVWKRIYKTSFIKENNIL